MPAFWQAASQVPVPHPKSTTDEKLRNFDNFLSVISAEIEDIFFLF